MIIRPADRTASVKEYYFSRKLKEIDNKSIGYAPKAELLKLL